MIHGCLCQCRVGLDEMFSLFSLPYVLFKEYLLEPDVVGKIRDLDLEAEAENKVLTSILNEALEGSTKVNP